MGVAPRRGKAHGEGGSALRVAGSGREIAAVASHPSQPRAQVAGIAASDGIAAVRCDRGEIVSLGRPHSHLQPGRSSVGDVGSLADIHADDRIQSSPARRGVRHGKRSRSIGSVARSNREHAAGASNASNGRANARGVIAGDREFPVCCQSPGVNHQHSAQNHSPRRRRSGEIHPGGRADEHRNAAVPDVAARRSVSNHQVGSAFG